MRSKSAAFPALWTNRLVLRAPAPNDAEPFRALLSIPDVTRYSNWPDAPSKAQSERYMRWMAKVHATGKGCAWIIEDRDTNAFIGAIPFLAAADMVESPLLKGTLYVCSTFVGFSRMTDNAHYPSQIFLGWYLAWASSRAVSMTETHFAGMEVRVVPLPMADLGGIAVEGRW